MQVTVFDAVGIGAGGSGAAAGLLHPFTPTVKLMWRAEAAMREALHLLDVAEAAAACSSGLHEPIAWRHGMLRPAGNLQQAAAYRKLWGGASCTGCGTSPEESSSSGSSSSLRQRERQVLPDTDSRLAAVMQARCTSAEIAAALVPGVRLPAEEEAALGAGPAPAGPTGAEQVHAGAEPTAADAAACSAVHVPAGVTLHPARYMNALWAACVQRAAARDDGSSVRLQVGTLDSVAQLHKGPGGPFSGGVVVAAGAAVGSLREFRGARLPLDLRQGYILDMHRTSADAEAVSYLDVAPSLLGSPYIASQGGQLLTIGATKSGGWSSERSLAECGRTIDARHYMRVAEAAAAAITGGTGPVVDEQGDDVAAAVYELLARGAGSWPLLLRWSLQGIRTGVRALPKRTHHGSIPLMGRWQANIKGLTSDPPTWLLVGLGARGLVYHAWLGRCAALALLNESEDYLPCESLAWRQGI